MYNEDKIISKINKLLLMANDVSSPAEAMIAAKKARMLMDKHQLSITDLEKNIGTQFLETSIIVNKSIRENWLMQLAASVACLNDCIATVSRNTNVTYSFRGFKADSIVSKLTLVYLMELCEKLCFQSESSTKSEKNLFKKGFAESINKRINQELETRKKTFVRSNGTSLIPLKKELIENHFGSLKAHKRQKVNKCVSEKEFKSYLSGLEHGNKASLNKQID